MEIVEFLNRWGPDPEGALKTFWDSDVRAGVKDTTWNTAKNRLTQIPVEDPPAEDLMEGSSAKGLMEAMFRLWEGLVDVIEKKPLEQMLDDGAKGSLVSYVNTTTYHDFQDEGRGTRAKKRGGDVEIVNISDLETGKTPEDSSEDDALIRSLPRAERGNRLDPQFELVEHRMIMEQLLRDPIFTPTEKKFLSIILDNPDLTLKEIGARMGISEARASQIRKSIHTKMRREHPELADI